MEYIEKKAEVFRVIRANSDKSKPYILQQIKAHLPSIADEEIRDILEDLLNNR